MIIPCSPVTEKETPKTMPPKYVRQGSTLSAILEQMQNSAENLKTVRLTFLWLNKVKA